MVGPRGSVQGAQILRDWVGRSGIRLEMRRIFARDDIAVVEALAEWRSAETGEVVGSDAVATIFRVVDDRVASIDRRANLGEALRATGLSESDEVNRV